MTGYVRGAVLASITGVLATGGCGSVPTIPGGPLQRAGTAQVAVTAVADASVVTSTVGTSRATHASMDAGTMPLLARWGGRLAFADGLDVQADWGWSGAGAEIRVGAPEGTPLPFALSLSGRSGAFIPFTLESDVRRQRELRVRLEAYPRLYGPTGPNVTRFHGVLAFGISDGLRYHNLTLQKGQDDFGFLRDETRVEGALGFEYRRRVAVVSLMALPYIVARGSFPTWVPCGIGHCIDFDGTTLVAFRQDFGVSLALTVSWGFSIIPKQR